MITDFTNTDVPRRNPNFHFTQIMAGANTIVYLFEDCAEKKPSKGSLTFNKVAKRLAPFSNFSHPCLVPIRLQSTEKKLLINQTLSAGRPLSEYTELFPLNEWVVQNIVK